MENWIPSFMLSIDTKAGKERERRRKEGGRRKEKVEKSKEGRKESKK